MTATHRMVEPILMSETSKKILEVGQDAQITDYIKKVKPQNAQHGQRRYIITGGPGSGKTSIIRYLAQKGYRVVPEAATSIIEERLKLGIEKPWLEDAHHLRINERIVQGQIEAQNSSAPVVFFDRGPLDSLSYVLLLKRKLYQYIVDCTQASLDAHYFEKTLFFIDGLDFIVPGPARYETLQESMTRARCLEANYRSLGYDLVHVPAGDVATRAQFILSMIPEQG